MRGSAIWQQLVKKINSSYQIRISETHSRLLLEILKEGVIDELLTAYSILRVFLQQALHEAYGLRGQVLREVYGLLLHVHDSVFRFLSPNMIEGSLAH